eukprot:3104085-Pyramimonas_sp.AAC.1
MPYDHFYHSRGPQSRANDARDNTPLMKTCRVTAASYIKVAKDIYDSSMPDELDQLNAYFPAWNDFANTIVGQILKVDKDFVRTPMIADGPRWSR